MPAKKKVMQLNKSSKMQEQTFVNGLRLKSMKFEELRKIDFINKKTFIFGLQGSGKTTYAKRLIENFDIPTLVWSPHKDDFKGESDNFIYFQYVDLYKDFSNFIDLAIKLAKAGQIKMILIDEIDMLSQAGLLMCREWVDLVANHRHFDVGIMAMSRRPQDVDTYFIESCFNLFGFSIMGDNVKSKLNRLCFGYGDAILTLDYYARQCVYLRVPNEMYLMKNKRDDIVNVQGDKPIYELEKTASMSELSEDTSDKEKESIL